MSGAAPALSAQTYWPFARARRLTVPLALWTSWKVSQAPTAVRLAISGAAPGVVGADEPAVRVGAQGDVAAAGVEQVELLPAAGRRAVAISGEAPALSARHVAGRWPGRAATPTPVVGGRGSARHRLGGPGGGERDLALEHPAAVGGQPQVVVGRAGRAVLVERPGGRSRPGTEAASRRSWRSGCPRCTRRTWRCRCPGRRPGPCCRTAAT